jgi:hypothetical protein
MQLANAVLKIVCLEPKYDPLQHSKFVTKKTPSV